MRLGSEEAPVSANVRASRAALPPNFLRTGWTMAHRSPSRFGWVRKRHTPIIAVLAVLAAVWAAHRPAHAAEPGGALRISRADYLYADHSEDFTDAKDGLTIEMWVRLAGPPGHRVSWPLISKDGSYAVALCGQGPDVKLATGWYGPQDGVFDGMPLNSSQNRY